ncbi:dipeptidyl-peptidase-4 [Gelidibacter algens]|uniref:Dipeptidyl-peptidase-4 n=1 Tax=Gelidibacter algens TaxID=49280 RepID=A0A1A7R5B7_9FLAO|nr:DPP IV N-terminal domain-containing protein [Gelidibacter algens]OBX27056.1 peptidase [Gelidibacter algens]RAJ27992.1 dipeptidyl-peptidase-4 [Gelidibacter algens]
MNFSLTKKTTALFCLSLCLLSGVTTNAQGKIKNMPGYDQYQKMASQLYSSVQRLSPKVDWSADGNTFTYIENDTVHTFDVNKKKVITSEVYKSPPRTPYSGQGRPARGRQYASVISPDAKLKAFTKDRNVYISNPDGSNVVAITSDGNEENLVKYGIATWVYGEELGQNTAMWWSPDSKKVAFYRFEEKDAQMYYVLYNQTKIQDSLEVEAYPKVGAKNLPVDLLVYDLETKKTITVDTRDGKPFNDGAIGTYLYEIDWSPDGKELLFHSTNRKQDLMEFKAANPITGKSRVVVREEWVPSFTENSPEIYKLKDNQHFIWASERNGFKNYYLYNFNGKLVNKLTQHDFEVDRIIEVDEAKKLVYYMAASGDNHMKMQLHRVNLDGTNDVRLTNPAYHHSVVLSPTGSHFIDIAQTHNSPPFMNLVNEKGNVIAELLKTDLSKFEALGFKTVETFEFTSADGETKLHGMIHFPSQFDPTKKYPLILSNYGGPATNAFTETFRLPNPITEFGFLVVNIDGRNVGGRGKEMLDKLYGNLGIVEMDDFAAGIKSLYDRPYFDKTRVGVYGTSYGGTVAAMSLLRFPEVYHAAVANSAVTDWRNYDNIYTERYMNLLENNKEGYEASSVMNYAKDLKGELMIFYGTNDNNVHPSNSLQLIQALQKAEKSFEVQVGPDQGHTAVNFSRMMEFFIQHLIMK